MKWPTRCISVIGCVLMALSTGSAFAGSITVNLSGADSGDFAGTGTAHFAGTDALERALRAVNDSDTNGPSTTVTIQETGRYEGDVYVTQPGIVIEAAAGVTPAIATHARTLDADDNEGRAPVVLGVRYEGDNESNANASLTLRGESAANRMILEAAPTQWGRCIHAEANAGLVVENVEFVGTSAVGDESVAEFGPSSGGEIFNNCYFNYAVNGLSCMINYGNSTNGYQTYNNCVFNGQDVKPWVENRVAPGDEPALRSEFNNCTITGSWGPRLHGKAIFNGCAFEDLRSRLISRHLGGTGATTDVTFDGCTFVRGWDVLIDVSNDEHVTIKNGSLNAGTTSFQAFELIDGYLTLENMDWNGNQLVREPTASDGVGPNLILDRCVLSGTARIDSAMADVHTEYPFKLTATNTIFDRVLINLEASDQGAGAGSIIDLNHCTIIADAGAYFHTYTLGDPAGSFTMNNSIVDCSGDAQFGIFLLGAVTGAHNISYDEEFSGITGEGSSLPADTIHLDPMLTDDGHISDAASPALGAATGSTLTIDVDGDSRPLGNTVNDIGADESALMGAETDTDGDGLSDSEEETIGTDPNVADTDGDDLSDGDEVNTYGTDPLLEDTDGDSYNDGLEVSSGSDPLDPDSTVALPVMGVAGLILLGAGLAFGARRKIAR